MAHLQRITKPTRNFPNGGWEARWQVRIGGKKKWRGKSFATKREAEVFLASVVTDIDRGEYLDTKRLSVPFEAVAGQWLQAKSLRLRPKTLDGYQGSLRTHVLPTWANQSISEIDFQSIQSWISSLSQFHSPSVIKNAYKVFQLVMNYAVASGQLRSNPCNKNIALPTQSSRPMHFLTHSQVEDLCQAISVKQPARKHGRITRRPEFAVLIRLAAYTGLRAGELAALKVKNVDLEEGLIHVVESVSDVNGKLYLGEPKTRAGRRVVTIDPELCGQLREHLAQRRFSPEAFVFVGERGGQFRHSNFYGRFWKDAVRRAGLPDGLRFHDLRHTYASFLVESGVHVKEMAELLGHASAQITLDRYSHVMPGAKTETAFRLGTARKNANAEPRPTGVAKQTA